MAFFSAPFFAGPFDVQANISRLS